MKTKLEKLRECEVVIRSGTKSAAGALERIDREMLYEAVQCRSFDDYILRNENRLGLKRLYQVALHDRRSTEMEKLTGRKFKNAKASILAHRIASKITEPEKFLNGLGGHSHGEITEKMVKTYGSMVAAELGIVGEGNEYPTPAWLFDPLNELFHFDLDAAATRDNKKAKNFFTIHDDSLKQDWTRFKMVWCNPPFDNIGAWAEKAFQTALAGTDVVLLSTNTTEVGWFQRYGYYADLLFIRDRVDFAEETHAFGSLLTFWHLKNWKLADGDSNDDLRTLCWRLGVFLPAVAPLAGIAWDVNRDAYPDESEDVFLKRNGWKVV